MSRPMTIDFVSDIVCPWCIIGLRGLEEGLARASDAVDATIRFHPFELNPDMVPEGENMVEHLARKYGSSPEQAAAGRATLKDKASELDFAMNMGPDSRTWNTFDAHRLLSWAALIGKQHELKRALFTAHFSEGRAIADPDVLVDVAASVGLDGEEARALLASDRFAQDVRQEEMLWRSRGIDAVPAIVFDGKYLVSGAQPPEVFEQVVRQIAAQAA